jgi:uncharacterized repeat protein (TIGR02543 family)
MTEMINSGGREMKATVTEHRRNRWFIVLIAALLAGIWPMQAPAQASAALLKERDMIAPVLKTAEASVLNAHWLQLYLREKRYNVSHVADPSYYTITSGDDPDFAEGVSPILINSRYFPEDGPYTDNGAPNPVHLNQIYRIFLKLPSTKLLKPGHTYTISVDPAVADLEPLQAKFDLSAPNEAIHVNQVGYMTDGPKVAYLSFWTGQGSIDFSEAAEFQLIEESTGQVVFTGPVVFQTAGADEKWGGSDLYAMDFTPYQAQGTYHLYVPGVGRSYSFDISSTIYSDKIGYTLIRALTLQRDGDHGLDDPNVTHWHRPAAHLDDAVDEASGQRVDLTGGHMDAGDRGKYSWNVAATVATMLTTAELFPAQVEALGESLQIPESGNGIPDYLDEVVYELDYLYKTVMNTSLGGALAAYIHPKNDGYEQGYPLEGATGRVYFNVTRGPVKAETLFGAGALAMAYNNPLLQQYFPEKMEGYRQAALRAFQAFEAHKDDDGFWKPEYEIYKDGGPHTWSDEMLFAAAQLHRMTGEAKYAGWIASELPSSPLGSAQKRCGWVNEGPWPAVFLALYHDPYLSDDMRQAARGAVLDWADTTLERFEQPYGVPLPDDAYSMVGWYFSGSQIAYPMMLAYGVSQDEKYRDQIIKTWNYLLGSNPLSRSYISGLGDPQRSPRWLVHEISQYQWMQHRAGNGGWTELMPGLPNADLQDGKFPSYLNDEWNSARVNDLYPALSEYPALYRYSDTWNVTNEFVTLQIAAQASSILPLVPLQLYTLSVESEHGTVTPSGGSYVPGAEVRLTAVPKLGYRFTGWSGDAAGAQNPLTITVNADMHIIANYEAVPTYTLTSQAENGVIIAEPAGGTYNEGDSVVVRAVPNHGYRFAGWGGDLNGTANPAVIVMDADRTIAANFEPAPLHTLTVIAEGGTVLRSPQRTEYTEGELVTLEALPDKGYVFDSWSGGVSGTAPVITLTMDASKTVTANFRKLPVYSLTLTATEGGSVSPGSGEYVEGSKVTLTATPADGYVFIGWSGDLTGMANPVDITMDADKTITANFQSASSVISQDITTTLPGSTSVDENGVYTITAAGENVWAAPDAMRYVYEMGLRGNFSITARLDAMTVGNVNGMAGVMIRTSTAPNAVYSSIFVQNGELVGRWRKGGDYSDEVRREAVSLPVWLKIERGPEPWKITTYSSEDGENWTVFTQGDFWAWMDAATPALTAGLFVNSGSPDQWPKYTTATFSNVEWPVDPNAPPIPTLILDQKDGTVNKDMFTLSGTAVHAVKVRIIGGDGAEAFAAVTDGKFSHAVTLKPGENTYTLTAEDGAGHASEPVQIRLVYVQPIQTAAYRAAAPPEVDGHVDEQAWNAVMGTVVDRSIHNQEIVDDSDNRIRFGLLWDDNYLYVGAAVDDAHVFAADPYRNDSLEVYVDMRNDKEKGPNLGYGDDDSQFLVSPGADAVTSWRKHDGVIAKSVITDTGYTVEMAIPWNTFGITPAEQIKIGFDIGLNDDDTGGGRTGVLMWSGTMDNWQDPANFGEAVLSGLLPDTSGPAIEIVSPEDGRSYVTADELTIAIVLSDDQSGVDDSRTMITLDGEAVQPGAAIALCALPLGEHTLTVAAVDLAGNAASRTVTFYTKASIDSLKRLVDRFYDKGLITNHGIANSLQQKLKNPNLNAFVNQVAAQRGKHIAAEAADWLLRDAEALQRTE